MDHIEIQTMTWHVSPYWIGTILMWHVAWIIFKKKFKKFKNNLKKFKKFKKMRSETGISLTPLTPY